MFGIETNSLHCLLHTPSACLSGCEKLEKLALQLSVVYCASVFILHPYTSMYNSNKLRKNPILPSFHHFKSQSTVTHLSPSRKDLILSTIEEITVCIVNFIMVLVLSFRKVMSCSKVTGSKGHRRFSLLRTA